jgi:hypothetical protein
MALAVWILSAIFRGEQEQPKERPERRGGEGRPRVPRRQTSELDRFLEEARARRKPIVKPVEEERPRPEPVILEAMPVEEPRERPRERSPSSPELRPKPRTAPPLAPPVRAPIAQPVAMPATLPAPVSPSPVPAMETRVPTQNPQAEAAPAPAMIVPGTRPRRPSPVALKLLEMLRDRQSLATAVMLGEVMNRPVAMRRGNRGAK